ncbi:PIN domain-containing protein [Frankia sp. Cas4]|uniref:PIN domain-containing protein n=1 Tax=Frankia sp. Cas4 TaxID=3073927 RepID=UPI002AD36326|nr:PIN domain-containing protein [Frankia sp. Cas4]
MLKADPAGPTDQRTGVLPTALRDIIQPTTAVTPALTTVEATRALTAIGAADVATRAIHRSDHIQIGGWHHPRRLVTATVLDHARTVSPAVLRSLDAIHLATALLTAESLHHLITYDKRMITAAEAAGLRTSTPS